MRRVVKKLGFSTRRYVYFFCVVWFFCCVFFFFFFFLFCSETNQFRSASQRIFGSRRCDFFQKKATLNPQIELGKDNFLLEFTIAFEDTFDGQFLYIDRLLQQLRMSVEASKIVVER
jgi:hypothetical protein